MPRERQHIVDGGESKPPAGGHHVYPNQPIQDALEAAARDPVKKHVYVHAGTYRPASKGQALIWLNSTESSGRPRWCAVRTDIADAGGIRGSFIHGDVNDLRGTIDRTSNTFDPPDPRFDAKFVPQAPEYARVGYRPVARIANR